MGAQHPNRLTAAVMAALASTAVVSAYVLNNVKWSVREVAYYVNAANLDLDPSAAEAAIRAGADAWDAQSTARVALVYAGTTTGTAVLNNGRNEVFFRNATNGSAIATAYTYSSGGLIVDADIVFWDGAYQFYAGTTGCSGGLYIEDTATHEFGHVLGLGHSADSAATMYATTGYCAQSGRTLAPDDIAGIEAIYPAGGFFAPASPRNVRIGR